MYCQAGKKDYRLRFEEFDLWKLKIEVRKLMVGSFFPFACRLHKQLLVREPSSEFCSCRNRLPRNVGNNERGRGMQRPESRQQ